MAVTIVTVIENVYLSRHRKTEHVTYRNNVHTPGSSALLVALKPGRSPVCPVYPESI
jgi:hypothetical protein